jgi:hypothetical protein
MNLSLRSQKALVWCSLMLFEIYLFDLVFLLHMLPPPSARWSAVRVAAWYVTNGAEIRIGAALASWVSAWAIPLSAVIAVQMYRHEDRRAPVWSLLALGGGIMMTVFLVLPPVFFGVAAFSPTRSADATAIMHELAVLTLVTTDQFFPFLFAAVAVICLIPTRLVHSPFPRWFGYYSIWALLTSEAAAIAYLTHNGPFAWDGFLGFWLPAILYSNWVLLVGILLLRAINRQLVELRDEPPNAEELSGV